MNDERASLESFVADLAALGRIRLLLRMHGGYGDVACLGRQLVVDDQWLVVRNRRCLVQFAVARLASAEVVQPSDENSDRPQQPCVWFFAPCGVPCLGIVPCAPEGGGAQAIQSEKLAEMRRRWVGRIVFADSPAMRRPGITLH